MSCWHTSCVEKDNLDSDACVIVGFEEERVNAIRASNSCCVLVDGRGGRVRQISFGCISQCARVFSADGLALLLSEVTEYEKQ